MPPSCRQGAALLAQLTSDAARSRSAPPPPHARALLPAAASVFVLADGGRRHPIGAFCAQQGLALPESSRHAALRNCTFDERVERLKYKVQEALAGGEGRAPYTGTFDFKALARMKDPQAVDWVRAALRFPPMPPSCRRSAALSPCPPRSSRAVRHVSRRRRRALHPGGHQMEHAGGGNGGNGGIGGNGGNGGASPFLPRRRHLRRCRGGRAVSSPCAACSAAARPVLQEQRVHAAQGPLGVVQQGAGTPAAAAGARRRRGRRQGGGGGGRRGVLMRCGGAVPLS